MYRSHTAKLTPPVKPKILSRSGGANTSYPRIDLVKFGAYSSMFSNTYKNRFLRSH